MKKTAVSPADHVPAAHSACCNTIQQTEFENSNLKALINNTDDLIWSIDCDMHLITWNKAFDETIRQQVGGAPLKKGANILETGYEPQQLERWSGYYSRALSGETFSVTEYYGSPPSLWTEVSFYPILHEAKVVGTACYSRNITQRKKEAQLLLDAYQKNIEILESIRDGFLTLDTNWIVTYWNKEAERMVCQPRENIIGKNIWEVYAETVPLKFYSETHKALSEQKAVTFEEFFPTLNLWIDASVYPSVSGLSIFFKDITEKKLAERKVNEAKERYEMVAKATSDAIYEWDIAGNTVYWNEGYEKLFGHKITGDKMPTESWSGNLHPGESEKLFASIAQAFSDNQTILSRELLFRCSDGSYKTVFDKLIIQYGTDLQPVRVFGSMQDITGRRQNEIAISQLNDQLNKRADELIASNAELEQFAYVASHDLQEPLRMVSSFLQLLEKKYKPHLDEVATLYINYAVDGAERMKRLILDLLEYSRVGTNTDELVETDFAEVMQQVVETFTDKIGETDAQIKVNALPVLKANKMQVTQLLQNLVSNSFKYNTSPAPQIEVGCQDNGNAWQFFVKDNGIGIEAKFFEKIFVIFQRLHNKSRFSGTGIGLAICKKIVEKHGGSIWVQSRPGEGSTFFFTISK